MKRLVYLGIGLLVGLIIGVNADRETVETPDGKETTIRIAPDVSVTFTKPSQQAAHPIHFSLTACSMEAARKIIRGMQNCAKNGSGVISAKDARDECGATLSRIRSRTPIRDEDLFEYGWSIDDLMTASVE